VIRIPTTLVACALALFLLTACGEKATQKPASSDPAANAEKDPPSTLETGPSPTPPPQKNETENPPPAKTEKRSVDLKEGKRLFYLRRCNTCHKTKGRLAMRGPSLAGVAKRLSREAMKGWILNPRRQKPDTIMPVFDGTDEELETILDFLLSLK